VAEVIRAPSITLFVSPVYCAESTVRWFIVREKHCWMAADSADKSKRTGCKYMLAVLPIYPDFTHFGLIWIHLIRENQLIIFYLPEWPTN
jgi:hypothetical protein